MSSSNLSYLVTSFAYQIPALLVYLIALVLAVVFLNRCLIPSVLTLIAVGILLMTSVGFTVIQAYLIETQQLQFNTILAIISSLARSVGNLLLVVAIFVGRGNPSWTAPPFGGIQARSANE